VDTGLTRPRRCGAVDGPDGRSASADAVRVVADAYVRRTGQQSDETVIG
jgi:hypothetical protein